MKFLGNSWKHFRQIFEHIWLRPKKEKATAINSVTQKINSTLACNFISGHSESPAKDWEEYPRFRGHSCDSETSEERIWFFFFWGYVHQVELQHIVVEFGLFGQCWASQHKSTSLRYQPKLRIINKLILHLVFPVLLELMVDCANIIIFALLLVLERF